MAQRPTERAEEATEAERQQPKATREINFTLEESSGTDIFLAVVSSRTDPDDDVVDVTSFSALDDDVVDAT